MTACFCFARCSERCTLPWATLSFTSISLADEGMAEDPAVHSCHRSRDDRRPPDPEQSTISPGAASRKFSAGLFVK